MAGSSEASGPREEPRSPGFKGLITPRHHVVGEGRRGIPEPGWPCSQSKPFPQSNVRLAPHVFHFSATALFQNHTHNTLHFSGITSYHLLRRAFPDHPT